MLQYYNVYNFHKYTTSLLQIIRVGNIQKIGQLLLHTSLMPPIQWTGGEARPVRKADQSRHVVLRSRMSRSYSSSPP
jgi:hypothetical protein